PGIHRHHFDPPLAPPFVNMTCIQRDDGTLIVGVKGEVTDEVAQTVREIAREEDHAHFDAQLEKHRATVETSRTLAQKGHVIEIPQLLVEMEGETFFAETGAIMESVDWSLDRHPAQLTEQELGFHRSQDVIEIDFEGEKLVYSRITEEQPILSGLHAPSDADLEASLVQWLERECRVPDISHAEMLPWIAAVVADLVANREIGIRTLNDWQHQIPARIRWKIQAIREEEKTRAH
ncbi:hypothetical protein, partial [Palleronia sp.]|uniref:hypothetical protein n=1 Tax=Palleronia sp. TaxID=1940284 RepID=UPI0035C7D7F6